MGLYFGKFKKTAIKKTMNGKCLKKKIIITILIVLILLITISIEILTGIQLYYDSSYYCIGNGYLLRRYFLVAVMFYFSRYFLTSLLLSTIAFLSISKTFQHRFYIWIKRATYIVSSIVLCCIYVRLIQKLVGQNCSIASMAEIALAYFYIVAGIFIGNILFRKLQN